MGDGEGLQPREGARQAALDVRPRAARACAGHGAGPVRAGDGRRRPAALRAAVAMNILDENRVAIACDGPFTYSDLDYASEQVAHALLEGRRDLEEERIAFPASPAFAY